MVKTIAEFRDELKVLREEMKAKGEFADAQLVASWLDRLVITLEGLTPSLGLMGEEMSILSEDEGCCCCAPMPKKSLKKVSRKTVSKKKPAVKKKPVKKKRK